MTPHDPAGQDLAPIDIGAYRRGNRGIDYVTTFDGPEPGPHAMIAALTHGNELCGAHALAFLFERGIRPRRGRLTLAFANVAAYESFHAAAPFVSRFVEEDFNRLWDEAVLDGDRRSVELDRARELRPVVDEVDVLLDIHSVDRVQPAMLLAGTRAKGLALARGLGAPRHVVIDAGHGAGRRLRDYARFDDPSAPQAALLVECGYHFREEARKTAIETCLRFLRQVGTVGPELPDRLAGDNALQPQILVEVSHAVTVETDDFRFARAFEGFEVVPERGTTIARDGEREVTTPYRDCVMVMPTRQPLKGGTAVRLGRIL